MKRWIKIGSAIGIFLAGCSSAPEQKPSENADPKSTQSNEVAKNAIEIAGGLGVARITIDGFAELDLEKKRSAYHYYRVAKAVDAAVALERSFAEQLVEMVFLGILQIEAQIPKALKEKVVPFVKRALIEQEMPKHPSFIPGEFAAVAQIATKRGVDLGTGTLPGVPLEATQLERLEALLKVIRPVIFGPNDALRVDGGAQPVTDESIKTPDSKETEIRSENLVKLLATPPSAGVIYLGWNGQKVDSASKLNALVLLPSATVNEFAKKLGRTVDAKQLLVRGGKSNRIVSGNVVLPGAPIEPIWFEYADGIPTNISDAVIHSVGDHMARAFSADAAIRERRIECKSHVQKPYFLTHRNGFVPDEKTAKAFGGLSDLFAEVHFHLTALNLAFDDRVIEMGALTPDCAMAVYDSFISATLEQWIWSDLTDPAEQRLRQARRLIYLRLLERGVVERFVNDGQYFARVVDHGAMKAALMELLKEADRISEERDIQGAGTLLNGRNQGEDESVRRNVKERYDGLGLPRQFVLLNPTLTARRDRQNKITDVTMQPQGAVFEPAHQTRSKFEGGIQ